MDILEGGDGSCVWIVQWKVETVDQRVPGVLVKCPAEYVEW